MQQLVLPAGRDIRLPPAGEKNEDPRNDSDNRSVGERQGHDGQDVLEATSLNGCDARRGTGDRNWKRAEGATDSAEQEAIKELKRPSLSARKPGPVPGSPDRAQRCSCELDQDAVRDGPDIVQDRLRK